MMIIAIMAGLLTIGLIITGILTYKYFAWNKKTRTYYCMELSCRKRVDCVHARNEVLRKIMGGSFNGKKLKIDLMDVIANRCSKFKSIDEVK